MKKPLVSVCIPTYNGAEFISQSLDSIINQSYENIEIIISDNQSTDTTLDVIKSVLLSKTTITYKIINNKQNGIGDNWNNCIKHSGGKYIKFLFQDDILEKSCISEMVDLAESNQNIGLVYSKRKFLLEDSLKYKSWLKRFKNLHLHWDSNILESPICSGKKYLKDKHFLNEPLNKIAEPSATLIRKECFEKIGLFRNDLKQVLDFELYHRIMMHYDIGFIDKKLVAFRLHDQQASQINVNLEINDYSILEEITYQKFYKYLALHNKIKLLKLHHPFFVFFTKTTDKIHQYVVKLKKRIRL